MMHLAQMRVCSQCFLIGSGAHACALRCFTDLADLADLAVLDPVS